MADKKNNKTRGPSGAAKSVPAGPPALHGFELTAGQREYLCYLLANKEERMIGYDPVGGTFQFIGENGRLYSLELSVYETGGLYRSARPPTLSPAQVLALAKRKRLEEMGAEEEVAPNTAAPKSGAAATIFKGCSSCGKTKVSLRTVSAHFFLTCSIIWKITCFICPFFLFLVFFSFFLVFLP